MAHPSATASATRTTGSPPSAVGAGLTRLADLTADHLRRWGDEDPEARRLALEFATDLTGLGVERLPLQQGAGRTVRALSYLPEVLDGTGDLGRWPLLDAAAACIGLVRWTEFYAEDEWSTDFLPLFANGEAIGPDGRLRANDVIVGLYLFGPGMTYPAHAHPAEEFYVPLTGDAVFEVGAGSGYAPVPPGGVVLHPGDVSHSIQTRSLPSFGIYGWRGAIHEPSWYLIETGGATARVRHPTIAKS